MPVEHQMNASLQRCVDLMKRSGASAPATDAFALHFNRVAGGEEEFLSEDDVRPIDTLPDFERFGALRDAGERALNRVAVVKLNGGLGTSMGLERAKSLLDVRDGLTFLDLIARQILALRSQSGAAIPLILMNSAHTAADSDRILSRYTDLATPGLPGQFLQNRVPKILDSDMGPAGGADDGLAWCPAGHGDLYTSIAGSGLL